MAYLVHDQELLERVRQEILPAVRQDSITGTVSSARGPSQRDATTYCYKLTCSCCYGNLRSWRKDFTEGKEDHGNVLNPSVSLLTDIFFAAPNT
jgi:hypothetical protein